MILRSLHEFLPIFFQLLVIFLTVRDEAPVSFFEVLVLILPMNWEILLEDFHVSFESSLPATIEIKLLNDFVGHDGQIE